MGNTEGGLSLGDVILKMEGITKSFHTVKALVDGRIELRGGEVHALLGENGAGKSTLIKVLGGIYQADGGTITINNEPAHIHDVSSARQHGVSVIHQELLMMPHMTIAENIFAGREIESVRGFVSKSKMVRQAQEMLDNFELPLYAGGRLGKLTIANQQMVEIIKAISFGARIIVMDEPTSSLSDKEVNALFDSIRKLKAQGIGIIYISHRLSELDEISDRITIMRDGSYIDTVVTKDTKREELISKMVGRSLESYYTREQSATDEIVLKVEGISDGNLVKDVSFDLKKGEILGFSGLVGSGRSEAMKCIFGLSKLRSGKISVGGKEVNLKCPTDSMKMGIGLVAENRKEEGLYLKRNVRYNISIGVLEKFIKGIVVKKSNEDQIASEYVDKMSIKISSLNQKISNLSGGNQQKAIIGRWLAANPKILILDEPTRGVDVGAKAEIYKIMNALAKDGMAIIMVSSEMPEILNMSDRVVVMSHGHVSGIVSGDDMNQETIMTMATKEF